MTDFTDLSDTTLSQDKPVTQSVIRALRDNPKAITEGAVGAPRVTAAGRSATYFQARRSGTQSFGSNGTFVVANNVEDFDPENVYSTSTFQFSPTKPGIYLISAGATGTSPSGGTSTVTVAIRKNGSGSIASQPDTVGSSAAFGGSMSALVSMNGSTDYIDVVVTQNSFATAWSIASGWISGVALNEA